MAILPQLHYIAYPDKEILFIHIGLVGGIVVHYHIQGKAKQEIHGTE